MSSLSSLLAMAPRERKTRRMCSFNGKSYVNFNDGFTPVHRCVEAEVAVRRLMLSVTHTKLLSTASGREFGKREEERGRGQRQKSLNEFCVFQQVSESRGNLLVSLASRPLPGGILRKCPHFLFLECVCMCVCVPQVQVGFLENHSFMKKSKSWLFFSLAFDCLDKTRTTIFQK